MIDNPSINAWLGNAPEHAKATTNDLLHRVESMRASEAIYPPQEDILAALAFTAPADVRVVILGQDPYHEANQAMGLSFSVPRGQKLPPSLRNIYKELSADLGCPAPQSGDLTSWAEQGVLLLNTTLTVREHAANSHSKLGWKTLTDYIVQRCFDLPQPIVFLAWGRHAIDMVASAQEKAKDISHVSVIASTHPSPLSATRAAGETPAFIGSRPFSRCNRVLQEKGSKPIDWQSVC